MLGSVAPATLNEAITVARSRLGHARRRLTHGELPPLGHLIIRHQLPVPDGVEALWAIVSTWPDPRTIHGRSLNDGAHPALVHIRMGSPVVVPASSVIDWAVIDGTAEIEEGGWTRGLTASQSPRTASQPPRTAGQPSRTAGQPSRTAGQPSRTAGQTPRTGGQPPRATGQSPQPVISAPRGCSRR
nr:hypothetical protein [Frankia sp. R43]